MFTLGNAPEELVDPSPAFLAERELAGLAVVEDVACGLQMRETRLLPECPPDMSPYQFYARVAGLAGQVVDFVRAPVNLTAYLNDPEVNPMTIPDEARVILRGMARPNVRKQPAVVVGLELKRYAFVPPNLRFLAGKLGSAYFADRTNPHDIGIHLEVWNDRRPAHGRRLLSLWRPLVEVAYDAKHQEKPRVFHPALYGETPEKLYSAMDAQDNYFGWIAMLAAHYKAPTVPDTLPPRVP